MTVTFPEFVLMWQRCQGEASPALHKFLAKWLFTKIEGGERHLLLLAFRNSGKSTLLGLLCAWLLAREPNHRILVLAAEQALASKLSRYARRVVEQHPFCRHLHQSSRASGWSDDAFTVNRSAVFRDPSLLARGIGGNITGTHADTVICDDVEVPNTVNTPQRREWLRTRLLEVEHIRSPDGLQIFAGTPHTFYSIYSKRVFKELGQSKPFLDGFSRCVVPVLKRDNSSAWPERFPVEEIAQIKKRIGPSTFASQMLLQPTRPDAARLNPDLLCPYADDVRWSERNRIPELAIGGVRMIAASAWWDPAYGAKKSADSSVIAVVFVDGSGTYWLHRVAYLQVDESLQTDAATQQCEQTADIARELHLPSITLESNGIGSFLPGLLRNVLARRKLGVSVQAVTSKLNKADRILSALDAPIAARKINVHESVFATPLIHEMREWRPGGTAGDDGLDAVAGAIAATPVRLSRVDQTAKPRDWRGLGQHQAKTDFSI